MSSIRSKRAEQANQILRKVRKIDLVGRNLKPKNWGRESEKKKGPWHNFSDTTGS